jgi:hypothetical protein
VYAIWVPALATDERSSWSRDVISDPRVRHYWDGDFALSEEVGRRTGQEAPVVYDVYAVYDADARWSDGEEVGAGRTIIGRSEQLRSELEPLLD